MTVKVSKPAINVREELADLRKPTGVAGEAMLRAETPQEQFQLIGAGRRNLVINGAMQVAQRGTSFTSAGTQYTLDRFKTEQGGIDNALINVTQDSDAPSGFAKSLKVTVATAETTVADNEYMGLVHLIEAQDLQQLDYNTAAAKSVTLSFWVKASVTGVYAVANYTADGSRIIGATYTINSANTWEYKTVTYAGDTAGQLDDNNGAGFYLYWYFAAGPDRKSSSNTSWGAYTGTKLAYGQEVQLIETVNATWQITGVQLELGKVATPFEHRSYGEELAACQRYFYSLTNNSTGYVCPLWQYNNNATVNGWVKFPVTMRAEPSLVYNTQGQTNWVVAYAAGQGLSVNTFTLNEQTLDSAVLYNDQVNIGIGNAGGFYVASASAVIQFDAEL